MEDLEAARESHAAQSLAEAAAVSAGGVGATGAPAVNGGKSGKAPSQVVEVEVGAPAGAKAALQGKGPGAAPGGKSAPGKPEKLVPFAVMRGPEVEQERWEVHCSPSFRLCVPFLCRAR